MKKRIPDVRELLEVEIAEHGSEHRQNRLRKGREARQVNLGNIQRHRILGRFKRAAGQQVAAMTNKKTRIPMEKRPPKDIQDIRYGRRSSAKNHCSKFHVIFLVQAIQGKCAEAEWGGGQSENSATANTSTPLPTRRCALWRTVHLSVHLCSISFRLIPHTISFHILCEPHLR